MRKVLATLFAVLLFAPALFARAKQDWEHVEKLKPGTPVLISLWSGETISGRVAAVSPTELQLKTADPEDVGIYQLQEFGHANIRRVVRLRRPNLPNPERWMLTGALIGGGVGLTAGAIHDVTHHDNYNWFTGAFGGAVLGFFGSCAVLAGVGVVELFHHHNTLVYEDQRTGKIFAH
jgi:hypothetical protein